MKLQHFLAVFLHALGPLGTYLLWKRDRLKAGANAQFADPEGLAETGNIIGD
jgi:hypothetical protein